MILTSFNLLKNSRRLTTLVRTPYRSGRSLYLEYLMTHKSLRAELYPNGAPPDDRRLIPNNELKDITSPAKKKK